MVVSRLGGTLTAGRIVETEAYLGPEDAAAHAAFRPSSRPLVYGPGGIAYVFLAYGMHSCLNAVAGAAGTPGCVLIRALEPVHGVAAMAARRGLATGSAGLTDGPAKLTEALAITLAANGADLTRGRLVIAAPSRRERFTVAIGPRVGITRATDWPLRYSIRGNRYVSRPRPADTP